MDEPVARSWVVTVIEHFGHFQSRRCRDLIVPATYQQNLSCFHEIHPAIANLPFRGIGGSASPYRRNGGSFAARQAGVAWLVFPRLSGAVIPRYDAAKPTS
jgi:hypothetical protein